MNQLTKRLMAVVMALALLGALAVSAEPVTLEGADTVEDLPVIGDLALDGDGIDVADVALIGDAPAAAEPEPAPDGIVKSGACGENVWWTLDSDGLLTISGSGDMDGETYFFYVPGIKRVVVEAGVTSIGASAFNGCSELVSVSLPEGLQNIWAGAFMACGKLPSIEIPFGIPFISGYAFSKCYSLAEITLPESVTEIVDTAFDECPKLKIRGYDGTYAQTYARECGIPFISLGASPQRTIPPRPTPTPAPTEPPVYDLAGCQITVADQVYTGKALKPKVTVTLDGRTLVKGVDYTVSYKNNVDIGKATVTVKGTASTVGSGKVGSATVAGEISYTGKAKATFKIKPKAVKGLKLTAGKRRLTATWKKAAGGVTGYQLQYGLKKDLSDAKKVKVKQATTVKKVLKSLKSGKYCYVRIRAYKKVGKTTYYSAWSGRKAVKVK